MRGDFNNIIPVEIEALDSGHNMVVARTGVVEVAPEGIFPVADQCLTVDEGGEGAGATIWLPQSVGLWSIKVTDKASDVA